VADLASPGVFPVIVTNPPPGGGNSNSLSFTVAGATASLSPGSLSFGSQSVGTTSSAQAVTLQNTGNASMTLSSIAVTGLNSGDFAQTNTCAGSVAAGASCTINVTFKPAATGTRTASVTISDNATGSPQAVNLTGTATSGSAGANVSPNSLAFGNQPVDVISYSQAVTLSNSGSPALTISSIVLSGANAADFTQNNNCGTSLASGGTCTIIINFSPSAIGARAGQLTVTDSDVGSPQTVSLSGMGTHDVILSWTASTTPGVEGYDVFRGATSGAESSTPLNSSPIAGTTYADTTAQGGQTYYYVVTAVASNGQAQSAPSSEASATVPSP